MIKSFIFIVSFFLALEKTHAYPTRPNPTETKGEVCDEKNPDFTEYRYKEQIPYCKRNVDFKKRTEIYDLYNIPTECRHRFTVDHFIPLSIGGSNDDTNLWPEHKLVKATRPFLEIELYNKMKDGLITQTNAIKIITSEKMKAQALLKTNVKTDDCDLADTF